MYHGRQHPQAKATLSYRSTSLSAGGKHAPSPALRCIEACPFLQQRHGSLVQPVLSSPQAYSRQLKRCNAKGESFIHRARLCTAILPPNSSGCAKLDQLRRVKSGTLIRFGTGKTQQCQQGCLSLTLNRLSPRTALSVRSSKGGRLLEEKQIGASSGPSRDGDKREIHQRYLSRSHHRELESPVSSGDSEDSQESANDASNGSRYLVQRGQWAVRKALVGELRAVASVQARVFHEPPPISALNPFFYSLFEAEVYDVLRNKAQRAGPNSYACLIAVPWKDETEMPLDADEIQLQSNRRQQGESKSAGAKVKVAGVVDAACAKDSSVLRSLPHSVNVYLYLTGMAVDPDLRREGVGSLLLEAVKIRARELGVHDIVLHVHEDNDGARAFYQRLGFQPISRDSWWATALLGVKPRLLMAKSLKDRQ